MNNVHVAKPFPAERSLIVDTGNISKNMRCFPVFLEFDVTNARNIIREYKHNEGRRISFTAFIAQCLAQALIDHKALNSYRKGHNQLIEFEDIDMVITQEVKMKSGYFPGAVTIRAIQNCSIAEIQSQQDESLANVNPDEILPPEVQRFIGLPQFFRRAILWFIQRDPIRRKEKLGTVLLSGIGMYGDIRWFFARPNYTLSVFLGGIAKKPWVVEGNIAIRDILHVTLMYNHDLVDAAPVARFAHDFKELVEASTGLPRDLAPQLDTAITAS